MSEIGHQKSRRDFLKKAAYTAPVILTMTAAPAFAKNGSYCPPGKKRVFKIKGNNGIGQEKRGIFDGPPPGLSKKGPNFDFNDNGKFAPFGKNGARFGGRPGKS